MEKGQEQEKKVFEEPKITIERFEWVDIITSSDQGDSRRRRFIGDEPGTEGSENA